MNKVFSCTAFAFLSVLGTPVLACPPPYILPPNVGETSTDYNIRLAKYHEEEQRKFLENRKIYQGEMWKNNAIVALAVIDKIKPTNIKYYGKSNKVRLKILRFAKGSSNIKHVWVHYTDVTTCGPFGGGDAVDGKLGDVFAIFSSSSNISSRSVTDTIGESSALDENIKSLFVVRQ